MMTYRREQEYNENLRRLEQQHRTEQERDKARGATESEKASTQARQDEERARLDQGKQMSEAIANSMKDTGTLRGLVSEGTGTKQTLTDVYERIASSAFGHSIDPTADAITLMDRRGQLQFAWFQQWAMSTVPGLFDSSQGYQTQQNVTMNMINQMRQSPATLSGGAAELGR